MLNFIEQDIKLLHELSNKGAQNQFEFPETLILLEIVVCVSQGDRECHIVILLEEDSINWDEDYPPPHERGVRVRPI